MKYTPPVYRPPYEANTLLLQVTVGCAHNKCVFCTMYRDVRFAIEKIDQVEKDLKEASELYPNTQRLFLVNGDAFVLSANRLKPIAKLIHKYLSKVEVITMYASINNIKSKTDDELLELRKLKINDLWVGAETGHAETLKLLNKGFSLQDSYEQLERLNKANMRFYYGFMFGVSGVGKGIENTVENARIINKVKPYGIVPTTLGAFGDSELAEYVEKGIFVPASEIEILEEQKQLIELIDIETKYMGIHGLNTVAFDAILPHERESSVGRIKHALNNLNSNYLNSVAERHSV